ncbi:MAG: TylF/MycF/NovP-related O-methyltransferase [Thermodesulfobacteriota bacterium]
MKNLADHLFEIMTPRLTSLIDETVQRYIDSLWIAMDHAVFNNVPGDYLEFGVRGGHSFIRANRAYRYYREQMLSIAGKLSAQYKVVPPMRFFAFDAFEGGLPEAKGPDATTLRSPHWQPGSMACSVESFFENMRRAGMGDSEVIVIQGYFEDTLSQKLIEESKLTRAAVIHLDCDYYESTATALKYCATLIGLGTIIIFDDFFRYQGSERHGQFLAFKEFCASNPALSFREMSRARGNSTVFICSSVSQE